MPKSTPAGFYLFFPLAIRATGNTKEGNRPKAKILIRLYIFVDKNLYIFFNIHRKTYLHSCIFYII